PAPYFIEDKRLSLVRQMPKVRSQPSPTERLERKVGKTSLDFWDNPHPLHRDGLKKECQSNATGGWCRRFPTRVNQWLGRETHEPVQIATETPDLSSDLKRGLAYVRRTGKRRGTTRISRSGKHR